MVVMSRVSPVMWRYSEMGLPVGRRGSRSASCVGPVCLVRLRDGGESDDDAMALWLSDDDGQPNLMVH